MPTVGSLAWALIADNTRFAAGTAAARKNVRGLHADLMSLKGAVTSVAGPAGFLALTAAVTGAATAAGMFVKEGVRMAAALEQLGVQMEVMTGSKATGGALMTQMVELAKETPFALEDVASAGKVLLAMGSSAGEVAGQIKMLGDVSAATGQPVNQLAQVFGEVQQAGRLTSNELRQFNMRGIPLLSELSDMLGVTKVELRGMVEAGEVSADAVEEAFERMTSAGGRFADMMGRQAETLTGQWERFKDSLSLAAAAAAGEPGTSGTFSHFLKSALSEGSRGMESAGNFGAMFQSQGFGAFTEQGKINFAMEQFNKQLEAQLALQDAQAQPTDALSAAEIEAAEAQERMNGKMRDFIEDLQLQVDTYDMASDAARLYEMRMRGATEADIEAAQALIDQKTKMESAEKAREEAEKHQQRDLDERTRLIESLKTPSQKFTDELFRLKEMFGDPGSQRFEQTGGATLLPMALADLQERIRQEMGPSGPAGTQSAAAIRAGSIEALRAQFSGSLPQKQLKEAEKQTKEQEAMRGLMETIADTIQGVAEAPG